MAAEARLDRASRRLAFLKLESQSSRRENHCLSHLPGLCGK
jgi:hypothetical protein